MLFRDVPRRKRSCGDAKLCMNELAEREKNREKKNRETGQRETEEEREGGGRRS